MAVLSTLDDSSGYWQIEIDACNKHKSAFMYQHGLYTFTGNALALKSAMVTFRKAMSVILASAPCRFLCLFREDRIVVLSHSPTYHTDHVRRILRLLIEARVTLTLKKCKLFADGIDYLCHVIRLRRLELAESTKDAVTKLESPTTRTELRCFLGLWNICRWFVPNFARLAVPLDRQLRKEQHDTFCLLDETEITAVTSSKEAFINLQALPLPRTKQRYTVDTDAFDKHIVCVLHQDQGVGGNRRVDHRSRTWNDKEQEVPTTHGECLPAISAVKLLRPYLEKPASLIELVMKHYNRSLPWRTLLGN